MKPSPSRLSIVRAAPEHAADIAPRLWLRDAVGIREKFGLTPLDVARGALDRSDQAWAAILDDRVFALYGVRRDGPIVGGSFHPWILPSVDVDRRRKTFWKGCIEALPTLLNRYGELTAECDADFRRSISWLQRMGFRIAGPFLIPGSGGICYVTATIRERGKAWIQ